MIVSKFNKLLEEFPFISETVIRNDAGGNRFNVQYLDFIRVELASPLILGKMPRKYIFPNCKDVIKSIFEWEQVHFVLYNGKVIRNAVRQHVSSHNYDTLGETVLEAIKSNNIMWDLRFVVLTEGGYNIFLNRSMPNFRATIYKLKNGTAYYQIIEEAEKAAREWENYYYHTPYGFSC